MKENNVNNKNVENCEIIYKPEGQMKKSVCELLRNSKEGNFNNLKKLIDEQEFQGSTLNLALRNLIQDFKLTTDYIECLKLLLSTNIDLFYKYPQEDNSTVLMAILKKNQYILIKEFLENMKLKSANSNHLSNEDKIKLEMLEIKNLFCQKDINNNNILYYMIKNVEDKKSFLENIEYLYNTYPHQNDKNLDLTNLIHEIFKALFIETNKDGNTIINFSLYHSLTKFILKIISIIGYMPNINKEKNNYIHSAILGKSFSCLKIILYHCSADELNMNNNEMLTPSQLAYKKGYITMSNFIIEYQKNFNEEEYKEHFYSNLEVHEKKTQHLINDLLISFINYKFKQLFYELNELRIINNMSRDEIYSNITSDKEEEDLLFQISYLRLEYNIVLTQAKMNQVDYEKNSENANNYNNMNNNKFGKNNKKKLKKMENKNFIFTSLKSFFDIFENNFTYQFIVSYIKFLDNNNINKNSKNTEKESIIEFNPERKIEILIYNKVIFCFKVGYFKSVIDIVELYISKIFPFNENNITDIIQNKEAFTLFFNASFILAEIFILQGYHNFAETIIEVLDKLLLVIYDLYIKPERMDYIKEEVAIFNYLSKVGVFNQFSAYFSEFLCYLNFLRLLISKDKTKEYFANCIKLLKDSAYATEKTIFNRLFILFSYIEVKKLYEKDDNQIYSKISELQKYNEEGEVFYFNNIGIIYLKKQKYHLSMFFFQKAFSKYVQIIKSKNSQNNQKERLFNFRIDYITSFLYNICLCHFYLKNYNKCINILEQLLLFKNNKNNYFFHYRLGLCYIQKYIESNKNKYDYYNENILKVIGYEKHKDFHKKSKSDKPLSINLENEDSLENLPYQFESKHKNNANKFKEGDAYGNKSNIYSNINSDNKNNVDLRRIILKNSIKYINVSSSLKESNFNNNNISNDNENSNNNSQNIYLLKAIKCFKKVIQISKMNSCTESMKILHNFYWKCKYHTNKEKNEENSQNFCKKKKIPNELLIHTYLNLLLCLSIKRNWAEMILIIKDYNNRKTSSNKIIVLKILLYKLEAYINLKNTQKIKEIINKLKGYKKIELSVFNKANNNIINEVNIKLYLYYTLTLIYIREKNLTEIEINMNKLLSLIEEYKNIPYYIIDLLINVYIIKLNNEINLNEKTKSRYNNIILNLIKHKKTNQEE